MVFRVVAIGWAMLWLASGVSRGQETAVLVEIATGRVVRRTGDRVEATRPGSTVKPLVLAALIDAGVAVDRERACRRTLRLEGHGLNCSHPVGVSRVDGARAIAFSCNSYFAEQARALRGGEMLERALAGYGLRVERTVSAEERQLQALGEEKIRVTPEELAEAYRRLARRRGEAKLGPVFEGMKQAVEFGTAQGAGKEFAAGKTGTARADGGVSPQAWFAGWAPRENPTHVLVVHVRTGRGAADAAPAAAKWWKAWKP